MHKLTEAIKQKKFEATCRELNDLINSLHPSKEISINYSIDHYSNYKSINLYFYKWSPNEYGNDLHITDSIWINANTYLSYFDRNINVMRNILIAFKKGEFVWSEQAAIAKQTH